VCGSPYIGFRLGDGEGRERGKEGGDTQRGGGLAEQLLLPAVRFQTPVGLFVKLLHVVGRVTSCWNWAADEHYRLVGSKW